MNQKTSHIKPTAPVIIKASCHPQVIAIQGTTSGARIAPTFVPELKIPVARARSFLGNHSATVLIAAGKLPASLTPSNPRQTPNPKVLLAVACKIEAILQTNNERAYPSLVPILSIT